MANLEPAKAPSLEDLIKASSKIAEKIDADIFLYNGPIIRGHDLSCIDKISKAVSRKTAILILVTSGGSPDAAYKISRYFQYRYEKFTVLISGLCKSAGTLIALGANELSFMPFGELGPLDIQLGRVDKFDAPQSGLAIQEALDTLESRARRSVDNIISDYMEGNDGLLSFAAASHAASEFVTQLYAPIFARIDPEEVGARSRSMRIAHEYGKRLAFGSQNLKPQTLATLAEKYPSHSFVIDQREAESLFRHVRSASALEKEMVLALGKLSRFPAPSETAMPPHRGRLFEVVSKSIVPVGRDANVKTIARTRSARNGAGAATNAGAPKFAPERARQKNGRVVARTASNGKGA